MPVNLQHEAENNLRYIRQAMERAERVSAVSGVGGMAMGFCAFLATAVASMFATLPAQLAVWIGTAFISLLCGAAATWLKARQLHTPLFGDASKRFLTCLVPALMVGAILSWLLWPTPQNILLPAVWMLLYGCGVLAAGTYAAAPVMQMGFCFLGAGLIMTALPAGWENFGLGLVFGGLHLYFGWQVFRNHGG